MKRSKNRSEGSLRSKTELPQVKEDVDLPPLDELTVRIIDLRIPDEDPKPFAIKVTFFDQLIVTAVIKTAGSRDVITARSIASGQMNYDPSDYEKMCLFADCPLVVHIHPLKSVDSHISGSTYTTLQTHTSSNKSGSTVTPSADVSCCNVDILKLILDNNNMSIKKRMRPMIKPPVLFQKSWDNLPILRMEITVVRNKLNARYHKVLKEANYMKLTVIGAYNMIIPYEDEFVYTAASKTPIYNETNTGLVTFNQGYREPRRFKNTSFYPKWESLRVGDNVFTKGDEKLVYKLEDIQNSENIDLEHYFTKQPNYYRTVWGSFHRTLILGNSERWLWKHLRRYQWPIEVHIYGETGGYSFMGFLNLFKLIYPGEDTLRLAVPLLWANSEAMMAKCGCPLLLSPNEKSPSTTAGAIQKASKATTDSAPTSTSTDMGFTIRPTGADDNNAFVLVEVKFAKPLKKIVLPPPITKPEISEMLREMELGPNRRECTGRGQLDRDWKATVKSAANSIRRVPYYGMTDFCTFNRQLSETRTRVELTTSCWLDAAVYVNNNFVIQNYLGNDKTFEEMVMMAHACLMRTTCETLVGVDNWQNIDPILRAARHARHMQDMGHAMDLYMQVVVQKPNCPSAWRELGTCLLDIDKDWARVCLDKSILLNPRDPLTLLSKGCMLFDEDPEAAEPFFVALLALHPYWTTAWVATNAYYIERELFHMADKITEYLKRNHPKDPQEDLGHPRSWESELGDWWDHTPLLPGMSRYYDAADLLLRLRAISLAEVCVARGLSEFGESAAYYHLVGLCCRLRGEYEDALCHVRLGLEKYGEIGFLRSLEAECLHRQGDCDAAMAAFEKAGGCISPYSILLSLPSREQQRVRSVLVDLLRRHPSAYAWIALADDWLIRTATGEEGDKGDTETHDEQKSAKLCAVACAVQALKWDRGACHAWALLAKLVTPEERRLFCRNMAIICGYDYTEESIQQIQHIVDSDAYCHRIGKVLKQCRCGLCKYVKV